MGVEKGRGVVISFKGICLFGRLGLYCRVYIWLIWFCKDLGYCVFGFFFKYVVVLERLFFY